MTKNNTQWELFFSPCLVEREKSNHKYVILFYNWDRWMIFSPETQSQPVKTTHKGFHKIRNKNSKPCFRPFGFSVLSFVFFFSVPCSNSCVKSNFIFYLLYRRLNFQIILQEKRFQTVTVPGCLSSSALRDAHAKNSRCYLELPCDNSLSETLPLWTQRQCKVDCCSTGLPPYFQGHPREIQLKHMLPFEFNGWGEVEGRLACMSSLPGCCCSFIY